MIIRMGNCHASLCRTAKKADTFGGNVSLPDVSAHKIASAIS